MNDPFNRCDKMSCVMRKSALLHMQKTKAQMSCMVTVLISTIVLLLIFTDFKNATPRLKANIFSIKNNIVMNFNASYSSIIVVYPLKISLSLDKFNI